MSTDRCEVVKRSKSFDRSHHHNHHHSTTTPQQGFNVSNPFFRSSATSSGFENESTSKMKRFYENLCHAKDRQLEAIRVAHQRRLERLISLEKQYKLLKEHLRSYVDEEGII